MNRLGVLLPSLRFAAAARFAAATIAIAVLICVSFARVATAESTPPTPNWVTPKAFEKVAPHPRLYVSASQLERAVKGRGEQYAETYEQIEQAALTGLREAENPLSYARTHHRQFQIVGRLSAMALQYHRTGDKRYIEASVRTIENMEEWMAPRGLWQLWHGGFTTAIAISYDLLHNDMTVEQRRRVVDFAREHCIRPFLQRTGRGKNMKEHGEHGSWWQHILSNWNPVCSGGPGMLALAMYDELDEAQTVIDRVNASFEPIIAELEETEGGWVEGLGYWNWTMHYMSLFYISYERTSGLEHEGFRSPGFRQTLTFVNYFVPYDEACAFGDNQHGNISNSLFAAAEQMGDDEVLRALQHYRRRYQEVREEKQAIREQRAAAATKAAKPDDASPEKNAAREDDVVEPVNISYGAINSVLIRPDSIIDDQPAPTKQNLSRFHPRQGWGALADRWPRPNVYVAYRAGQLGGAHTQDDLLSWQGVIGNEHMIKNIHGGHVGQNAYGGRRNDLFEISSQSKNSLLVGGLGPKGGRRGPASAKTAHYLLPTGPMALNVATRAMDTTRNRPRYAARAFLIIRDRGLLVLDRVISPSGGGQPVEARAYTPSRATFGDTDVLLEGEFQTARMSFASNVPSTLSRAVPLLSFPRPDAPTMIRWQTNATSRSTVLASLLTRGADPVDLAVEIEQVKAPDSDKMVDGTITVTVTGNGWSETVQLDERLKPIAPTEPE